MPGPWLALRTRLTTATRLSLLGVAAAIREAGATPPLALFALAAVLLPALGPIRFTIPLAPETSINFAISRRLLFNVVLAAGLIWILPLFPARRIVDVTARLEAIHKGRDLLFRAATAVAII